MSMNTPKSEQPKEPIHLGMGDTMKPMCPCGKYFGNGCNHFPPMIINKPKPIEPREEDSWIEEFDSIKFLREEDRVQDMENYTVKVKSFIRTHRELWEKEVLEKPMGVSAWKQHGLLYDFNHPRAGRCRRGEPLPRTAVLGFCGGVCEPFCHRRAPAL